VRALDGNEAKNTHILQRIVDINALLVGHAAAAGYATLRSYAAR
jgi:hypothetical protein